MAKKKRFIFDENYIKKYKKRNQLNGLIIALSILAIIVVIIVIIMAVNNKKTKPVKPVIPYYELFETLTIESGSLLPEKEEYFKAYENVDINNAELIYPENFEISYDLSLCSDGIINEIGSKEDINYKEYDCVKEVLKTPAKYGVIVKLLDKEYTVELNVVDTTAPTLVTNDIEIYKGATYKATDFVKECYDVNGECTIEFYTLDKNDDGTAIDYSNITLPGKYKIKIIAIDKYENTTSPIEANLTIIEPEKEVFTVKFDSNGGSNITSVLVEDGNIIKAPNDPTRSGYTFEGWYLNNNKFDFNTPITKNITLKANWKKINNSGGNGGGGSSEPSVIPVTSVHLDYSLINVTIGESKTVTATVNPNTATDKTVTWSSSDNSIATVNNGKITGVKVGSATITATAGGKTSSVKVNVYNGSSSVCTYGDTNYNQNQYILSVNLSQNNCAVNPNINYNENVSINEYQKLVSDLTNMGFNISTLDQHVTKRDVRNVSGTGLVGYELTYTVIIKNPVNGAYLSAIYIINSDGSRRFSSNNICNNGVCLK